jgi:hypothetical protein
VSKEFAPRGITDEIIWSLYASLVVVRLQWLMQLAHLTFSRLDLLEVAIDDTLKRKLILALLFRDTLVLHHR